MIHSCYFFIFIFILKRCIQIYMSYHTHNLIKLQVFTFKFLTVFDKIANAYLDCWSTKLVVQNRLKFDLSFIKTLSIFSVTTFAFKIYEIKVEKIVSSFQQFCKLIVWHPFYIKHFPWKLILQILSIKFDYSI